MMRNFVGTVTALVLLATTLPAQDSAWSWLTSRPNCPPAESCPWRPGLLWDTTNVMPRYPEVMRAVGITGYVDLTFGVDSTGHVDPRSVRVDSSTNRAFEPRAVAAVKGWQFESSAAPGRPTAPIPMRFRLVYALVHGCRGEPDFYAWGPRGARHELIVLACEARLVPRDQIRPMNGPG